MKLLLCLSFSFLLLSNSLIAQSSLYNIKLPGINGVDTLRFSNFQGKKILVVNTACLSGSVKQFAALEQLYQKFKDSGLVVIACPSNSFGNEPGTNQEIQQFFAGHFSISFPVTEKINVAGGDLSPLYQWLSSKERNSVMNIIPKGNFTKVLINGQGSIVGLFSEMVNPMDDIVINTIRNN